MKNRILSALIAITLVICLSACGTAKPKLGHYEGTNPVISFDVTANGIENFTFSIPFGGGRCTLQQKTLPLKSDGTFGYALPLNDKIGNSLIGTIKNDAVSGEYSFSFCMGGGQLSIQLEPEKDVWTAKWISP